MTTLRGTLLEIVCNEFYTNSNLSPCSPVFTLYDIVQSISTKQSDLILTTQLLWVEKYWSNFSNVSSHFHISLFLLILSYCQSQLTLVSKVLKSSSWSNFNVKDLQEVVSFSGSIRTLIQKTAKWKQMENRYWLKLEFMLKGKKEVSCEFDINQTQLTWSLL